MNPNKPQIVLDCRGERPCTGKRTVAILLCHVGFVYLKNCLNTIFVLTNYFTKIFLLLLLLLHSFTLIRQLYSERNE